MDVLDPAFAPGVTVPVPTGILPNQLLSIINNIVKFCNLIGFDMMEICPKYDINDMTQYLGYRIILETINSSNNKK